MSSKTESRARRSAAGPLLVTLVLVLVVAPFVIAQYQGVVDVDAVVAPVTVRTSAGRVVTGISPSKFHLYVDGMEVIIQDISPESDLPLSLGFVLDTSGSMAGRKTKGCQQLIHAFLKERRREDQIALWTFGNERVIERFPFGMGWYLLPRILETIRPWSTTAIYDMVQRVPDVMERARHPRRAAILLTDGVDTASTIDYQEATRLAQHMQTPIYVLGIEPPPRKESEGPSYEEILTIIAASSGGYYQRIPSTGDMPEVARALLEELSSRYILSFATSGVGQHKWRTISVTVEGHEAATRKGYMGTLP